MPLCCRDNSKQASVCYARGCCVLSSGWPHSRSDFDCRVSGKLRELWAFLPRKTGDLPPASFTAPKIRGRSSKLNLEFVPNVGRNPGSSNQQSIRWPSAFYRKTPNQVKAEIKHKSAWSVTRRCPLQCTRSLQLSRPRSWNPDPKPSSPCTEGGNVWTLVSAFGWIAWVA